MCPLVTQAGHCITQHKTLNKDLSRQAVGIEEMDQKKSPNRRTKRPAKVLEDNDWDCSVCTYRNTEEAFKCLMCDVRKGTSTRKPRISPQIAAQQYNPAPTKNKKEGGIKEGGPVKEGGGKERSEKKNSTQGTKAGKKTRHPPRLKNVDRSTAQTWEVTVNNVTVVVTEYKPKSKKSVSDQSGRMSSASSENGSQSESSVDARSADVGTDSRSS